MNRALNNLLESIREELELPLLHESEGGTILKSKLEAFPQKRLWTSELWKPQHNAVVSSSSTGWSIKRFSILLKKPYTEYTYFERFDGIVVAPDWETDRDSFVAEEDMTAEKANELVAYVGKQETLQETVDRELSWMEKSFGITIPAKVRAAIKKKAFAWAKQRFGAKPRMGKSAGILFPLDGSKPKTLGTSPRGRQPWEH